MKKTIQFLLAAVAAAALIAGAVYLVYRFFIKEDTQTGEDDFFADDFDEHDDLDEDLMPASSSREYVSIRPEEETAEN